MPRSLIPAMLNDFWPMWNYPQGFFDFRLMEDPFFQPGYRRYILSPQRRAREQDSNSAVQEVISSHDQFRVMTDVSHFSPEDITVKTVDNCVVIHGKHEEKVDQHGFVSREFTRRYVLPKGVDPQKVTSSLSSDGVLTVKAPKKCEELPSNERVVPITVKSTPAVTEKEKFEISKQ
ncbi:alpha-crystallin A chain-like [Centruroides sculpturatus]|uniref:alpha-crystallin A chain-like n=1 Tax=Centruroides sculpturatus TaxID=218467 RepID=UPI000C6E2B4F|nr:alpha-crystallin A chain-like [Centruroides sculpturatus]